MRSIPAPRARATAQALLQAAGLDEAMARPVADKLIESDLLGHRTHGLAMLPVYLERLGDGRIATQGTIDTLNDDGGANFAWQANRLPGAWVMSQALDEARRRAERHAVVTATVGN